MIEVKEAIKEIVIWKTLLIYNQLFQAQYNIIIYILKKKSTYSSKYDNNRIIKKQSSVINKC